MRFENRTIYPIISEAIKLTDEILNDPTHPLLVAVNVKKDWKYNTPNKYYGYIVDTLTSIPQHPVKIFTYRPWNPWTSAIGYSDGKSIYFNVRRLSNNVEDLVATIIHEWSHHVGFGHGNNYKTEDKVLHSVPYFLSENVSRWL